MKIFIYILAAILLISCIPAISTQAAPVPSQCKKLFQDFQACSLKNKTDLTKCITLKEDMEACVASVPCFAQDKALVACVELYILNCDKLKAAQQKCLDANKSSNATIIIIIIVVLIAVGAIAYLFIRRNKQKEADSGIQLNPQV